MTLEEWQACGHDVHSVWGNPMFIDPDSGDYRVSPESPTLKLGFLAVHDLIEINPYK